MPPIPPPKFLVLVGIVAGVVAFLTSRIAFGLGHEEHSTVAAAVAAGIASSALVSAWVFRTEDDDEVEDEDEAEALG